MARENQSGVVKEIVNFPFPKQSGRTTHDSMLEIPDNL